MITDKQVEDEKPISDPIKAACKAYDRAIMAGVGEEADYRGMAAALKAAEQAGWQPWGTEDMGADALFSFDNGWIGIMEGHDAENYARQKTGPKPTHWRPLPEPPAKA